MTMLGSENESIFCKNLTVEESLEYTYTDVEFILILICIPVICILGLLLNTAYLFVLYRVRDMRTTTNVYLGNLAVADSFLLFVRLIRYVGTYFYSPVDILSITPFDNYITCGFPLLLINFFNFVSVFFILLVALERYNAICRPLAHRRVKSKRRTLKLCLFAWILPFAFVSCHTGSFDLQKVCLILPASSSSIHVKVCRLREWVDISLTVFDQSQFFAAFIMNCTMYIFIVRKLSRQSIETHSNESARERNHVAKMLIINASVFFVSLMPMQVVQFCVQIDRFSYINLHRFLQSSFLWIAILTSVINSAVNPLIYGVSNPNYRKAFRDALFFPCLTARADTPAM